MQLRYLRGIVVVALLLTVTGQAWGGNLLGDQVRLRIPQGGPPFDGTATVIDPGVEFTPYNQVAVDIFADNTFTFTPLVVGDFITFDAILVVTTPGIGFTGVTLVGSLPPFYSLSYDAGTNAIVVHHDFGSSGFGSTIEGQFTIGAVPEPASMTLLGLGVAGVAVYGWRRRKAQLAKR
jgi:hypothetical protein